MSESGGQNLDISPDELEQGRDTPIREGLFKSRADQDEAEAALSSWVGGEIERALAARRHQETSWLNNLRLYESIPYRRVKNIPIVNASNLEIPLGAIASDAIFAQMLNLFFRIDPPITAREIAADGKHSEDIKALQRFIDIQMRARVGLREAVENTLLDDTQLGTGVFYIPWRERVKKTQSLATVIERGPVIRSLPVEDFLMPGGAYSNIQDMRWVAAREWLTLSDLELRRQNLRWDITGASSTTSQDAVRQARERLGRHPRQNPGSNDSAESDLYQIWNLYGLYDIDGDGIAEDLLVTFDYGGQSIMNWRFNPFDRRPFEDMRYQPRAHLFYGMGVIEMQRAFQETVTRFYNTWIDNALLANTRFWLGRTNAFPDNSMRIWPNRFVPVPNPQTDVNSIAMSDVYPSSERAILQTIALAEKRTGINDLTSPQSNSVLGTRTPGITALSVLQQANERFVPAYTSATNAISSAARQVLYRYQERFLANDEDAMQDVRDMLGIEDGNRVINLLSDPTFDNNVVVELASADTSANKESDRQNWLALVQQIIIIGEKIAQLAQLIESPETGNLTKEVAKQLVAIANEILDRTLRTFDQVRDPATFLVDIQDELDAADAAQPQDQLTAIAEALAQQVPVGVNGNGVVENGSAAIDPATGGLSA